MTCSSKIVVFDLDGSDSDWSNGETDIQKKKCEMKSFIIVNRVIFIL